MRRLRTFVALELDGALRQAMFAQIQYLQQSGVDAKWVEDAQFHLTLKFLGEILEKELPEICGAVERAARKQAGFQVAVRGLGAFPSAENPRTLWMGIDDRDDQLARLQQGLELELADLGFRPEPRKFQGHLTLGRIRHAGAELGDLVTRMAARAETEFGWLAVDELVIFSSQLTRSGPEYTAVGHFPLEG